MDDLMPWLRARLDDDERNAHKRGHSSPCRWRHDECDCGLSDRVGRDLREVDAKRRIAALHEPKLVRSPKTVTEFGPVNPGPPVTQELRSRREMRDYWVCPTCCDGRCYEAPGDEHESRVPYCCETVPLMALPYSDRDGYRPEWAPEDE